MRLWTTVHLWMAVTGTMRSNAMVGNSRLGVDQCSLPWLGLDFSRIGLRAAILKAAGSSPVCKDCWCMWRWTETRWGNQIQKEVGKKVVGANRGPQRQAATSEKGWRVVEDAAAEAAIYSCYISDYLNVIMHNVGQTVWTLTSAGLIRVYYWLRGSK